jgi:hypothetical protein
MCRRPVVVHDSVVIADGQALFIHVRLHWQMLMRKTIRLVFVISLALLTGVTATALYYEHGLQEMLAMDIDVQRQQLTAIRDRLRSDPDEAEKRIDVALMLLDLRAKQLDD